MLRIVHMVNQMTNQENVDCDRCDYLSQLTPQERMNTTVVCEDDHTTISIPKYKVSYSGVIFMQSYPVPNFVKIKWQNIPLEDILSQFRDLDLHEHVAYHFKNNQVYY